MITSVMRIEGMDIRLPSGGVAHGADQEWYRSHWQRLAGCGPSTASNMLRYFGPRAAPGLHAPGKDETVALMHRVWDYVTPGIRGLNTTQRFKEGMDKLLREAGSPLRCRTLDIPGDELKRPGMAETADFIRRGLKGDSPVAFLNLNRGALGNLDNWHWVSLISLDESGGGLTALAADNGNLLSLDLKLWLETTSLGGGFVYCA